MTIETPWSRLRRRIGRYEEETAAHTDEHGYGASDNLPRLQKLRESIDREIDREIIRVRVRDQGMRWSGIEDGSSIKQAAQQRHAAALKRIG